MQRSSACFFKLATESPASYESSDVDGKSYVEGREFRLINLGIDFIRAESDDKLRFVDDVFDRRFRYTKDYPVSSLDKLVGDEPNGISHNEIARALRDGKHPKIWGRRALGELCGSPKVHVGPELAEGAPGGPVTGAFPGFSLGVLVMGQGPVEARGKRAVFSKARWARLCVRGAGSFHRACPFVTSGPRGALLHLPRVQLVKSRCPYDLRGTCVIFQPERWGPNSQTLAPLRVRAHRGDHAL